MLSLLAGFRLLEVTGSETMASGYFVNASRSLASIGGMGIGQMLQNRFPSFVSGYAGVIEPAFLSIINTTAPTTTPLLHRAPPSASNATTRTTDSDSIPPDDTVNADSLDTVTSVILSSVSRPFSADSIQLDAILAGSSIGTRPSSAHGYSPTSALSIHQGGLRCHSTC